MSSNLDKFFKTEKKLESEGVWFDVTETASFKLKRFGGENSTKVKALMAKHYKPYARLIENGSMEEKKQLEITAKIFVESSLCDWKGVEIDGAEVPYSPEAAIKLLMDLPELFDLLFKNSQDVSNFREDLGN